MDQFKRDGAMEVSGRRFTWRELGKGPPMLLVQGYAGSADDWPPEFLTALGDKFSLIVPDNRGVGGSELGDASGVTIDSMAADLEALLDGLGIERIPVVGFSMGGFVAQAFSVRAPARVGSLGLISTDPGGSGAIRAAPADWARLVDHSGTPRERATRMISVVFPPDVAPQFDRQFGELVAASQATLDPAALAAEERAMADWWEGVSPGGGMTGSGSFAVGTVLIVAGTEDLVIPPGNAELLARRFPGARIETFAGTGHAVPAMHPKSVASLIATHLET